MDPQQVPRVDRPARAWYQRILTRGNVMADLKAQFEQAAKDLMALAERPDNDTLLRLYALYKQGAEGDVSGDKPGFFDFIGTAKYDAWEKLTGLASEDAMKQYIALVNKITG